VTAGDEQVYLVHLDPPYKHARHYVGSTEKDVDVRLEEHRAGRGARILQVQMEAGGDFHLVRTWPGGRDRERAIKDRHEAPKLCPECSGHPKPVEAGRSGERPEPEQPAAAELPAPPRADPYTRGTAMAEQWLRMQAGRTAGQIAATHDYVTGPWREAAHHTPAQTETMRGYTDLITAQLTQLRQAEAEAADRPFEQAPQHEMEAGQ
jgi:predicted GIY-YIG superfamily endonuclease